jgi:glutamine amidotransferase
MPGVFRSIEPAWNDRNLQELAGRSAPAGRSRTSSPRRVTGPADELSPVRHGRRLMMHEGCIGELSCVRRDLDLAVDSSLFPR